MVGYNELKKGTRILMGGEPYEIIEANLMFKGRGHSVLQAKLRNLLTGELKSHTFHPSDEFEEPDLEEKDLIFLYSHRGKYVFHTKGNKAERWELKEEVLGEKRLYLKEGLEVEGIFFEGKLVNIDLPIKVVLKVTETQPSLKGQTAARGTKPAVLETGLVVQVPLFINPGDLVEVNTQTGEYIKRVS